MSDDFFWYMRGQQDQQDEDQFRRDIQRFSGTGPEAELAAFAAQNEQLVNYANDLIRQVNALQRENAALRNQHAALEENHRRLKEWALTAQAQHAEDRQTRRAHAATANEQMDEIVRLQETIEDLEMELADLRQSAVRTG
jgi:hypothetical protein